MSEDKNIVIVGGGFAGTALARQLEKRLKPPHRLILVSEESYSTFNPMLAEVVGASVFPEQVIAPIRPMLRQTRFIMGTVEDVDARSRSVRISTLAGERRIEFAHLVLAFGVRANLELVPGLREHALPLKLVGDALHIRNQVLQKIARMELESDPAARRRLGHFVVIGGGFSGVEVAGALADFLRSARRFYPRVNNDELAVTILHDTGCLLPELPARLGMAAAASLRGRRIQVRLGSRAARVDDTGVVLASGEELGAATVVCTIGSRPNPLAQRMAASLGLPLQRGRIGTRADMSVPCLPGLWALGDCALVENARTGLPSPPTAQFAVAQAQQLARNILPRRGDARTAAFSYRMKGMMATVGHMKGVAQVYGVPLRGLPAWLLWRALYLMRMPTFGRKLRIFVEWSWSMFFPVDVTHLRFTRSADADLPSPQVSVLPELPHAGSPASTGPIRCPSLQEGSPQVQPSRRSSC